MLCLLLILLSIGSAGAQVAGSAPDVVSVVVPDIVEVTTKQLETARSAVESDPNITESIKPTLIGHYDQALTWLEETTRVKQEFARLVAKVKGAPERIEELRVDIADTTRPDAAVLQEVSRLSQDQLDLAIIEQTYRLTQSKEELKKQQDALTQLLVGAKGLSEDIAARNSSLERIAVDLETPVPDESQALTQARILALKARRMLRQNELDLLKLKLGSTNTLTSLAQAERDALEGAISRKEPRLAALKERAQEVLEERVKDARAEAEEMQDRSAVLPPVIRVIAGENAQYRNDLEVLIEKEKRVIEGLERIRSGLEEIKTDFEQTRQRVDVVGPSVAIGKMLMRRRSDLPSVQSYRRTSAERVDEISHATDRQIDIDELLRERSDLTAVVSGVDKVLSPELSGGTRAAFLAEASQLARNRREALRELQSVYGRYIGKLTSLDLSERELVSLSGTFTDYIDEQLMWIPGTGIESLVEPSALGGVLLWYLSPSSWFQFVEDIHSLVFGRQGIVVLVILPFCALLLLRRQSRRMLVSIGERTRAIRTDSFLLTIRALGRTLVIVGAWPLLMVGFGWLLTRVPSEAAFTPLIANGMLKAGLILFSLGFLREICLPNGLGDKHLHWSKAVCEALVRELTWVLPFGVILGFLVAVSTGNLVPQSAQIAGQLAFIALMVIAVVFLYRLLRSQGALMLWEQENKPEGALIQLHFIWFPLIVMAPVALALTSALGYQYTAQSLAQQGEITFWFFVVLYLLRELLLRSLYIAERRLRYQDALRRRDELRAQREREEHQEEEGAPVIPVEIEQLDFDQLGEQAEQLIRAGYLFSAVIGTWLIWIDLLPALSFLNNTELPFQASRIVDGVAKQVPVTLGDLVVGLIIVLITILAAKNLPGILEITLLQRLPLDPGARYAITALSQYTIAGIGVFTAFSTLGLQWSSIQWLVAALSVGLGFGLQEIVANFISGIILLFERPIRVGDRVTISNTTGVVSRIRIRATTITNYDKQELLIPNKQIITGEVINWTLTDKVNRILLTIGVAYGTDVQRAMQLLVDAANENTEVISDPKPVASFEAFGDNALTLFLRAYLDDMDNRLTTITALHNAVNDKFNEAGIEISFPQRDIHLDTLKPLEVRISRNPGPLDGVSG
ncbi:MAG: mechanosensitive ion channel [Gammaproteobacteria bacterium]|nr:mechanosensitive ion channel [Gammaproteobacteria bacterium]